MPERDREIGAIIEGKARVFLAKGRDGRKFAVGDAAFFVRLSELHPVFNRDGSLLSRVSLYPSFQTRRVELDGARDDGAMRTHREQICKMRYTLF